MGVDLLKRDNEKVAKNGLPEIQIDFNNKKLSVIDNCGGIPFEDAQNEIFNFGHSTDYYDSSSKKSLGVYGIGLKRAIFKIGKSFSIISKTINDGFLVKEPSLDEWVQKDSSLDDWTFSIEKLEKAKTIDGAGTKVLIENIRKEVQPLLDDDNFIGDLKIDISRVYTFFLNKFVKVKINGDYVDPLNVPIGESGEINPAVEHLEQHSVKVTIFAGVAARDNKGRWVTEQAGWYVACNGRMILTADRTSITGWGTPSMPIFVSKFRAFVGLVLFQSNNPFLLPWTTTKRSLNYESNIYQFTKARMGAIARSILSFISSLYVGEEQEKEEGRELADKIKQVDINRLSTLNTKPFEIKKPIPEKDTALVHYFVKKKLLQAIRKHIMRPSWSNSKVGKYTFDYFLKKEKLDE